MSIVLCGIYSEYYDTITPEQCLQELSKMESIATDTETTGLSEHLNQLKCIQMGNYDTQYIIHPDHLQLFKELLETKYLLGHNLSFDLKFLYKQGIYPNKVYDSFLVERVLYTGDEYHRAALNIVLKARLKVDIDKSFRKGIENKEITGEYIAYAADDVKYLHQLREHQMEEAIEKDLVKCCNLENEFVLVLAYLEFCGFKLDADKWRAKMTLDNQRLLEARQTLDALIFSKDLTKYIDYQGDLFSDTVGTRINWSSSKQVIELFTGLGVDCWIVEKGVRKQSVASKNIEKYAKQYPFIKDYLKYKELEKVVGTYGSNFLDHISPVTGRVHTRFKQIMDTGRTSSGSESKSDPKINFQNIPHDKVTRGCFVSESGNVLVDVDYSSMETVVLTNKSMEKGLLEFFDNGYTDTHSYNARKIFKEISELSLEEIKANHDGLRQKAKTTSFALAYGGAASTIAEQLNIPLEEGEELYKKYFEAYPGLKDYFKKCENQALKDGYILMDERNKRKCYIYNHKRYQELNRQIDSDFWDAYKIMKKKDPEDSFFLLMKAKVKEYFMIKGNIQRMSMNYPIQSTSASITKIAGIYFFKWLKEKGLIGKVLIANMIHDEYLLDCPESLANKVKEAMEKSMQDAGLLYYTRVPLKTSSLITTEWQH